MPPDENTNPVPIDNPTIPEPALVVEEQNISLPENIELVENKPEQPVEISTPSNNPNITIEKTPDTITITEVMQPIPVPVENIQQKIVDELRAEANVKRLEKRRKKVDKVMEMFLKSPTISNNQVEKFLHVSDATATRYLNILEKENRIKQTGNNGRSTVYTKV